MKSNLEMKQQQANYENEPANPTFPMQDQFGRVIAYTGLSKLELLAGIIASGYCTNTVNGQELYPAILADQCIEVARHILGRGQINRIPLTPDLHIEE